MANEWVYCLGMNCMAEKEFVYETSLEVSQESDLWEERGHDSLSHS